MPTTAIRHGPQGDFVWVLQPDQTVKVRPVKSGPGTGETTSIASGLTAGETVITEGGDRLRDGAAVTLPGQRPAGAGGRQRAGAAARRRRRRRDGGVSARLGAVIAASRPGLRARSRMSPSRPFILRPVATSLLMAAILLAGLVAFHFLSLSALPEVDYPTIQVQTSYPGASPEVMAETVTAPLERQFGEMTDLNRMSSISSGGSSVITLQFNLDLCARRRRAGGAGGDQRGRQPAADRPARAADLRQGQSGRRADPDPGADLQDHAAHRGARAWPRQQLGAEDLADRRRRPRHHRRRPAAGGAHPGQHPRRWPPTA